MRIDNILIFMKSKSFIIAIIFLAIGLTIGIILKNKTNKNSELATSSIIQENNNSCIKDCPECVQYNYNDGWFSLSKKYDPEKELFQVQKLGFLFPKGTRSKLSNASVILMNNKLYRIDIDTTAGLCYEDEECDYIDEKNIPNIGTMRIWKKNNKVFAINPQKINLGDNYYFLGSMVIQKVSTNLISDNFQYFTDEEIEEWKNILSTFVILEN